MKTEGGQLNFGKIEPDWGNGAVTLSFNLDVRIGGLQFNSHVTPISLRQGPPRLTDVLAVLLGMKDKGTSVLSSHFTVDGQGRIVIKVPRYDPSSFESLRLVVMPILSDPASWLRCGRLEGRCCVHCSLSTCRSMVDARAVGGAVFSIPSSLEEVRRLAGSATLQAHEVFLAGFHGPLFAGQVVCLTDVDLVRLVPPDHTPLWAPLLNVSLTHLRLWDLHRSSTRESSSILLLHSRVQPPRGLLENFERTAKCRVFVARKGA